MAWKLAGSYVGNCNCHQICPCAVDGPPTSDEGVCRGLLVFQVNEGSFDDLDLSGVRFAMSYFVPKTFGAGDLKLGAVVDDAASDEQAEALERILKGEAGGPFEAFAALTAEWRGTERASISYSDGDSPSAKIGDMDVNFEPFRDSEGNLTTAKNAAFGMAPEFTLGQSSGPAGLFGDSYEAIYGEAADFEYTS